MKKITISIVLFLAMFLSSCTETKKEIVTLAITEYDSTIMESGVLIDVRTPEEFAEGHLPNAINIDVKNDNFTEKMGEIKKKETVYLYCRSGKRSLKATSILDTLGYKKIFNLDGGFLAWDAAKK